ncbi:MAG: alpha/beta hydrolase [Paracoccaceae bacterium]
MTLYRGMDADALEVQYNARATVDDIQPYLEQYRSLTDAAKASMTCQTDVAFGPSEAEVMDIYPAGPNAPVFVFIHGGYWRLLSKDDSGFMAPTFSRAGITTVAVNYALAPAVTLTEITRQCRAAVAHLWHNADRFGIDRTRIYVGGSSAGGHLTGMLATRGWEAAFDLPAGVVAGAIPVSGLFDLTPLRHCHQNEWLSLTNDSVATLSPMFHIPSDGCPMLAAWGEFETAEFARQSRDFAADWADKGGKVETLEVAGRNHFDVILDLTDPTTALTQMCFGLAQGNKP